MRDGRQGPVDDERLPDLSDSVTKRSGRAGSKRAAQNRHAVAQAISEADRPNPSQIRCDLRCLPRPEETGMDGLLQSVCGQGRDRFRRIAPTGTMMYTATAR